jgi:hypothetical protein
MINTYGHDCAKCMEIEDGLDLELASNKELRSQGVELAKERDTLREMLSVCRQQIESLEKARV